jgi:hypothetical protein
MCVESVDIQHLVALGDEAFVVVVALLTLLLLVEAVYIYAAQLCEGPYILSPARFVAHRY